jgi:DNA replication and repair protein RecF
MPFADITFWQFRNIHDAKITIDAEQIFFVGPNGQGKTNFLEAIYCLCYGSSFRTKQDTNLVTLGNKTAALSGLFYDGSHQNQTPIKVQVGDQKTISIAGKTVSDRRDLMDIVPCVVFCHEDIGFVQGGPEEQRQFFNQTAALVFSAYVFSLRNYSKTLKTRNLLLKQEQYELLPVYDQQLAQYGVEITNQRHRIVDLFNTEFTPRYEAVSGGLSGLWVKYCPSWPEATTDFALSRLRDKRPIDMRFASTTSGPHRDKFLFVKDDREFLPIASTGQIRLISLLLRLCQAVLVANMMKKKPILLLDDVLLELDPVKRQRFILDLPKAEQAFFTFLPDFNLETIRGTNSKVYQVKEGAFHEKSG